MLLEAASLYEQRARAAHIRDLAIIITGKGPMRAEFERVMRKRAADEAWAHVRMHTAWLAAEDYPRLLGSADLGVSLHTSSSGLDLPMKVVDMLGCGLRVCALTFPCLHELVEPGVNGDVFSDAQGLAGCLERLANTPPAMHDTHALFPGTEPPSWNALWDRVMLPLLPS